MKSAAVCCICAKEGGGECDVRPCATAWCTARVHAACLAQLIREAAEPRCPSCSEPVLYSRSVQWRCGACCGETMRVLGVIAWILYGALFALLSPLATYFLIYATSIRTQGDEYVVFAMLSAIPVVLSYWQTPCATLCCRCNVFPCLGKGMRCSCVGEESFPACAREMKYESRTEYLATSLALFAASCLVVVVAHLLGPPVVRAVLHHEIDAFTARSGVAGLVTIYIALVALLWLVFLGAALRRWWLYARDEYLVEVVQAGVRVVCDGDAQAEDAAQAESYPLAT